MSVAEGVAQHTQLPLPARSHIGSQSTETSSKRIPQEKESTNFVSDIANKIFATLGALFKAASSLLMSPTGVGRVLRFAAHAINGTAAFLGIPGFMGRVGEIAGNADTILDCSYVLDDFGHFGTGEVIEDAQATRHGMVKKDKKQLTAQGFIANAALVGKRVSLVVGNIISPLLLLDAVKILDLGKIADSMGGVSVIGPAVKAIAGVGLSTVARGAVASAYTFGFIDASIRLWTQEGIKHKWQAGIDMSHALLEVVGKVIVIVGFTNVAVIAAFGALACALGIVSIVHQAFNADAFKKERLTAEVKKEAKRVFDHQLSNAPTKESVKEAVRGLIRKKKYGGDMSDTVHEALRKGTIEFLNKQELKVDLTDTFKDAVKEVVAEEQALNKQASEQKQN